MGTFDDDWRINSPHKEGKDEMRQGIRREETEGGFKRPPCRSCPRLWPLNRELGLWGASFSWGA